MEWNVLTQIIERNDGGRLWREVYSIPFCKVQTASWEHVSKTEASQNKNKTWWSTLDAFIDPKQNPATLKNKQKQKQTNKPAKHTPKILMKPILTRYGFSTFSVLNMVVQSEIHLICGQRLLPPLIFENNKPWGWLERPYLLSVKYTGK